MMRWTALVVIIAAIGAQASRGDDSARQPQQTGDGPAAELWAQAQEFAAKRNHTAALEAAEAFLAQQRDTLGPVHEDIVATLTLLAEQSLHADLQDRSLQYAQELYDQYVALHGDDAPAAVSARWLVDSRRKLFAASAERRKVMLSLELDANDQLAQGKFLEAIQTLQTLAGHEEQVLGGDHPNYAITLATLADAWLSAGEPAQAESPADTARQIREQTLGPDHPDVAYANWLLGLSRYRQEKYREAMTPLTAACDGYRKNGNLVTAAWIENWLGDLWLAMGDHEKAIATYTANRQRFRELKQPEAEASVVSDLATVHESIGQAARAESLYRELLEIDEATFGKEHATYAEHLNDFGMFYWRRGKYTEAEPLLRESLAIRGRVLGALHADYALSLNNLGSALKSQERYAEAEPLFRQALRILLLTGRSEGEQSITTLNNLADLLMEMGRYRDAEPLLRDAIRLSKQVLGTEHSQYDYAVHNLGVLDSNIGDFAQAESLLREAARLRKQRLGEDHKDYLLTRRALASVLCGSVKCDEARSILEDCLRVTRERRAEDVTPYEQSLGYLAWFHSEHGDHRKALELFVETKQIVAEQFGTDNLTYALMLNNTAFQLMHLGEYAEAERQFQECLRIRSKRLGPHHPYCALILNNLSLLYIRQGKLDQAEEAYARSFDIVRHHLRQTAAILTEQQQFALTSEYRWYLDTYLSALVRQPNRDETAYSTILGWKGQWMARQRAARIASYDPDLASIFQQLQEVTRQWATLAAVPQDRELDADVEGRLTSLSTARKRLERALSLKSAEYAAAAQEVTSASLKASLPASTVLIDFFIYDDVEIVKIPEVSGIGVSLERTADGLRVADVVAGLAAARDGRLDAGDVIVGVKNQEGQWVATKGMDFQNVGNLVRGPAGEPVSLRITRAGAGEQLEFAITRSELPAPSKYDEQFTRKLLAFVVRSEGEQPVRMFDLGDLAPIAGAVDTWRASYGVSDEGQSAARQLRAAVWEPLLEAIEGAETVLVSPDGALGKLPFAALPGKDEGTFLIEDHRLAVVPVPQLIPALMSEADRRELPRDLLLMGDVDYDQRQAEDATDDEPRKPRSRFGRRSTAEVADVTRGTTWNRLAGAAAEVAFIRDLYTRLYNPAPESIVDRRQAFATEEQFREYAPQCYLLHLATHGFFATPDESSSRSENRLAAASHWAGRGNPFGERYEAVKGYSPNLLSGLVFAGANTPPPPPPDPNAPIPDDGYLTASEIACLPLGGVRLVVLSACETGLGEVAGGEGLLGIQRAFQVSGAQTTIASLWKVNDATTRRLMEEFYRNYLESEQSPLDALRNAQLWALRNPTLIPRGADAPDEAAGTHLPPYYWAAFTLSGDWR